MMIDDDELGGLGLTAHPGHETFGKVCTPGADPGFARRIHFTPQRVVLPNASELRQITGLGFAEPVVEHAERARVARTLTVLADSELGEPPPAQVVRDP